MLFLVGLFFVWQAVSGIVSGGILWYRRYGPDVLVFYAEEPVWFQLIFALDVGLGALFWTIAVLLARSTREGSKNEERYFRQKSLIEPKKD